MRSGAVDMETVKRATLDRTVSWNLARDWDHEEFRFYGVPAVCYTSSGGVPSDLLYLGWSTVKSIEGLSIDVEFLRKRLNLMNN